MAAPKNSGRFGKGNPGKPKGAKSHLTKSVKEAFQVAFDQLQGHPEANLGAWAANNTTDFYKLASKLIPAELNGHLTIALDLGILAKP